MDQPSETTPVDGRPRPQLWRTHAGALDGTWAFSAEPGASWQLPGDVEWQSTITVPFSPETPASGVAATDGSAWWYRRAVTFAGRGGVQVLHFGAIDETADVWVDGEHVAQHEGGYTPLRVPLRGGLASAGTHELVVRAVDDPTDLAKPRGKQTWDPEPRSIWYPRTVGIWQPVWTERLCATHLDALWWRTDLATSTLQLQARVIGATSGYGFRVRLRVGDRVVADDTWSLIGNAAIERGIVVDRGAGDLEAADVLWSPRRPTLIDALLELIDPDGEVVDTVETYAGMRSVEVEGGSLLVNGQPYRHRLVLDQGYWPDTGLTAPSDEALRHDVELTKDLGFNGVRKHQKIEDPRYLYWADRLGLLVWEELPAAYRFDDVAVRRATRLWGDAVVRDRSHPCVVGWIPVNESWGVREIRERPDQRAYVRALYELTRALDATRPVVANDGWEDVGGDIVAVHDYDLDPGRLGDRWRDTLTVAALVAGYGPLGRQLVLEPTDRRRPVVLSEFGGISLTGDGWGYEVVDTADEFLKRFEAFLDAVRSSPHLAGFCYTQLTDTYQETNGLLTADRTPKAPAERIRAAVRGRT